MHLHDFGVTESDIIFVENQAQLLKEIASVKQSKMLGFDTEFRCNDSNDNEGGVSIL